MLITIDDEDLCGVCQLWSAKLDAIGFLFEENPILDAGTSVMRSGGGGRWEVEWRGERGRMAGDK
jgi:hypothetical protein